MTNYHIVFSNGVILDTQTDDIAIMRRYRDWGAILGTWNDISIWTEDIPDVTKIDLDAILEDTYVAYCPNCACILTPAGFCTVCEETTLETYA